MSLLEREIRETADEYKAEIAALKQHLARAREGLNRVRVGYLESHEMRQVAADTLASLDDAKPTRFHQCEWCDEKATYRVQVKGKEYARYSCNDGGHKNKTERLVQIDNGDALVVRTQESDGFPIDAKPADTDNASVTLARGVVATIEKAIKHGHRELHYMLTYHPERKGGLYEEARDELCEALALLKKHTGGGDE